MDFREILLNIFSISFLVIITLTVEIVNRISQLEIIIDFPIMYKFIMGLVEMVDFVLILQFVVFPESIKHFKRDSLIGKVRFFRPAIGVEFEGHILIVTSQPDEIRIHFRPGVVTVTIGFNPRIPTVEDV